MYMAALDETQLHTVLNLTNSSHVHGCYGWIFSTVLYWILTRSSHVHGCYGSNSVTYCTEYHPSSQCTWLLWIKFSTVLYWVSKQPAHGLWVKLLHINWYQSSLHMGYGWNSYILTDIKAACTWAMDQILTYWLISKQPAHGLWMKFLHINWYQSNLHMGYGWNSYILTDIRAACTWAMGQILTY